MSDTQDEAHLKAYQSRKQDVLGRIANRVIDYGRELVGQRPTWLLAADHDAKVERQKEAQAFIRPVELEMIDKNPPRADQVAELLAAEMTRGVANTDLDPVQEGRQLGIGGR